MKNRGNTIAKIIFLVLSSVNIIWADSVSASVNNTEVVKGNPIQLVLKAVGNTPVFPTINSINNIAIEGSRQQTSNNMSIVNGSFTSESSTTLILQFTPDKDMIIPSYLVKIDGKEYKTQEIAIKVVKAPQVNISGNEPYFILMRTNKKTLLVGETAIVTSILSVSNRSGVREIGEYAQLHSNDFFIKELGKLKEYRQGNAQIFEKRYSITAKKEGNLSLDGITAKLGFQDTRQRNFFGMGLGSIWKQTRSNSLDIKVLPLSKESDILGDFTVKTSIDAQEIKANKPVNLSVHIEGKGSLENFEFPKYEIDGVMVYSDDAKIESKIVDGELYSTYSKSFALISDHSFSIPKRSFSMFSLKDKTLKSLDIQAFDITVKAPNPKLVNTDSSTGIVQSKQSPLVATAPKVVEKVIEVQSTAWTMLVLAFIAGMLTILSIQALGKRKKSARPYKESEALKILYAHISESKDIEEMVRKLYARKNGDKSIDLDKKALKEMIERFI